MEPTAHARTVLAWTPEGLRKAGRSTTTWRRTVLEELRIAGIHGWERAARLAQDRVTWSETLKRIESCDQTEL